MRCGPTGLPPEIVTGGGTGTHLLDLEEGPFTEIQPGSYLFMDKQYGAVELAPGGAAPFRTSLTVATRVISANQPDLVVLDAGFKAMATDAGPALVAGGAAADAAYQFMGDEHGGLRFGAGRRAAGGRRSGRPWSRRIAIRPSTCTTGFTSCKTGVWSTSGRSTRAATRRLR